MKAILFIILSSISVLINAQTLKAFLYTANFNSLENKSYIETYLSFDVNTVQLIQDKNALMRVAFNSEGLYVPIESLDSMFSHIEITPVQLMKNHQISGLSLQKYWWIIIILLSMEWFIRKKLGML